MSFTLKIVFTGICSLVTDKRLGENPTELNLVLLDAWNDSTAVDGRPMKRHGAMIQFPLRSVTNKAPQDGRGVWYPERQRLTFTPYPPREDDFREDGVAEKVADMARIMPEFSEISRQFLDEHNPPRQVVANATFRIGTLRVGSDDTHDWRFESTLGIVKNMAFQVVLEISGLEKMIMTAEPFAIPPDGTPLDDANPGSGGRQTLEIVGENGQEVVVTIAHLCDENPLIWPFRPNVEPPREDRDFKWHYEILSDAKKSELQERLQCREAPFPILIPKPPLGRGRNCFPGFWVAEP
jgi:hypothetical protein